MEHCWTFSTVWTWAKITTREPPGPLHTLHFAESMFAFQYSLILKHNTYTFFHYLDFFPPKICSIFISTWIDKFYCSINRNSLNLSYTCKYNVSVAVLVLLKYNSTDIGVGYRHPWGVAATSHIERSHHFVTSSPLPPPPDLLKMLLYGNIVGMNLAWSGSFQNKCFPH